MTHSLAERIAWYSTLVACCGGTAIIIAYCDDEPRLQLTTAIAQPIASHATTYCPDRWDLFELREAQEACFDMAEDICWLKEDDFEPRCFEWHAANCTVGNTHRSWAP